MKENNAAQPVLTETELDAIHAPMQNYAACNINVFTFIARAIESAVLSKLRAEGMPVAEPAFYINAAIINPETGRIKKNIQGGLTWSETRVGGWQMPVYAAPVASAPADERAKLPPLPEPRVIYNGEDDLDEEVYDGDQMKEYARAALASAPVAGEAKGTDRAMLEAVMNDLNVSDWNCPRCGHAEECSTMDAALMLRDYLAAPQASEAVRPDVDAVDLARVGMELHSEGMPEHTVCAELVRLADALKSQPQADKDGGQQKYWLCCGSKDPYHGNRRAPDCFNTTRAKWGTADEHSKDSRAALSATQTEQGERDA